MAGAKDTSKNVTTKLNKSMIDQHMTLLDVVYKYPDTEAIFHSFDAILEQCILCNNLFDSIDTVCKLYSLNQAELLTRLNLVIE